MTIFGITDEDNQKFNKEYTNQNTEDFDDGDTDENHIDTHRTIPKNKYKKVEPPPEKEDLYNLATNVVDILDEDLKEFEEQIKIKTKDYIKLLSREIIPHVLAVDAAIDYTKALVVDGLGRDDIATDNSLIITTKWLLLSKFINSLANEYLLEDKAFLNEKLAELWKAEMAKSSFYNDVNTVGVVKSREQMGIRNPKR